MWGSRCGKQHACSTCAGHERLKIVSKVGLSVSRGGGGVIGGAGGGAASIEGPAPREQLADPHSRAADRYSLSSR